MEGDKRFKTPMQWMWIENGEEIGGVSTVECSGTWPNIAETGRKSGEGHRRCQKIRETSKPLASLLK